MTWLKKIPGWVWIALVLRTAFAIKLGDAFYQADESGFHQFALSLIKFHRLIDLKAFPPDKPIIVPPVPSFIFALLYALGDHAVIVRLTQAAISALTAWMIGAMTAELTGSARAGKRALILASIYPFFIYYSGMVMSETLYLALIVPAAWMTGRIILGGTIKDAIIAGFCWSFAALTRVEAFPIAVLIWGYVFYRAPNKTTATAILCWTLPLFGWSLRNKAVVGTFSLDSHGGITLLHGTVLHDIAEAEDTGAAMSYLEKEKWYQDAQNLPDKEKQILFTRKAVEFMKENPARMVRMWAQKFVAFWRFYPRTDKVYNSTAGGTPDIGAKRWVLVLISLLFEPWLIVLGWLGLWRLKNRPETWPLWIFALGSTGIHVLIVSMMRYRLAVMPLLMLGACFVSASVGEPVAQDR